MKAQEQMMASLNRLCKWRTVLAGWQLGTRSSDDPEAQAVRDMRDSLLTMRAELSALVNVLVKRKVIDLDEYYETVAEDAEYYSAMLEQKFPGFTATDTGMHVDAQKAAETTKNWRK